MSRERNRRTRTSCRGAAALAFLLGGTIGCATGDTAPPPAGEAAGASPGGVDLRPRLEEWGLPPRVQGDRPTCSALTIAGALEYAVGRRDGTSPRLSPEFLNWAANGAAGDEDDGAFFSDLWKGYLAHGICTEGRMPYRARFEPGTPPDPAAIEEARAHLALRLRLHWIKEWNVRTGLTPEHLAQIKRTLEQGWPVCAGLRWPIRERWVHDTLQMCPPEAVIDGHSVLLVGYRDDTTRPGGGVLLFRNTSGRIRNGLMPYAYAQAYMNDAAWIESGERGGAKHARSAPAAPSGTNGR